MSKKPEYRYYWSPVGYDPIEIGNDPLDARTVIHFDQPFGAPRKIVCIPTPGPDGMHYVPDWWGITEHG